MAKRKLKPLVRSKAARIEVRARRDGGWTVVVVKDAKVLFQRVAFGVTQLRVALDAAAKARLRAPAPE